MRKLMFLVCAACAACAAEVDAPIDELEDMPPLVDEDDLDEAGTKGITYAAENDICAQLPDDGSACAHACDPDALAAFIPEGTCVAFECPLNDGRIWRTGGCSPTSDE